MESPYQILMIELKKILMAYGIKCKKTENSCIADMEKKAVINKWSLYKLEKVTTLIKNKYEELEKELNRVGDSMNTTINNLDLLNELLIKLEKPVQQSITKAKKQLKIVYINIFDLEAGLYNKQFLDIQLLRKYTKKNRLFYPLKNAKNSLELKCVLQKF